MESVIHSRKYGRLYELYLATDTGGKSNPEPEYGISKCYGEHTEDTGNGKSPF